MEKITDESFGVIPAIKKNGVWKVLLVHQISHRGGEHRFWAFPKGHAEPDELPVDTARRELMEETSLHDVQIIERAQFRVKYHFTHEEQIVDKTVIYYLGLCNTTETKITQPEEIAEIKWFTVAEAGSVLTHKKSQEILMQAAQYINEHSL